MSKQVASEFETQSLNALVAGFSFAAAIAWMDVVRWTIASLIKTQKNGGVYYLITALMTTLLSIIVYMLVVRINGKVKKPAQPVFAITR